MRVRKHLRVSTHIRQRHHKVMKVGFLSRLDDLVHADAAGVISILYVLRDAAVEQHRLLGHDANLRSQERYVDCMRRTAINQLKTEDDVVQTEAMASECMSGSGK